MRGRTIDLMKKIKLPVYFDQKGVLVNRFGIQNVPATIKQEGLLLKVTEVTVDD